MNNPKQPTPANTAGEIGTSECRETDSTFRADYWPLRNPGDYIEHEHDMREVAAALVLAVKGAAAEVEDSGPLNGNTSMGLDFLAMTLWHMTIQFEEHGSDAGKAGVQ